ncbi:MAG: thiamine diphosphokinase [Chloroflexota bacterium]|nr:thiamine diphosphokinase [Chloroflexota bacterium]
MARRVALVFAAAPLASTRRIRSRLSGLRDPYVIAADGGAGTALAFGFQPHVVVGDLDSIGAPDLAALRQRGVPIETHPRDKDATDGQLAVERALSFQPACLLLLGFLGGPRLDQALASIFLLARLGTPAVLLDEHNECRLLFSGAEHTWSPEAHEVVSLLPLSADVNGVRTFGLRWPLDGERLLFAHTRGVSNAPSGSQVRVSIEQGQLLLTRHFPDPEP